MIRNLISMTLLSATLVATTASSGEVLIRADAPDALIVGDAPRTVTVSIIAAEGETGTAELQQVFINRYGERTEGETIEIDLGKPFRKQVEVPVEFYGPATYQATLIKDGRVLGEDEQMLIRPIPVPILTMEQRAHSPIGINTHHNAHWETLARMGIHWARDYSWGWIGHATKLPRAENNMDFSTTFQTADEQGITILPIMQNSFRTPDKKFFIDDTDLITAAYKRLSNQWPQIPYWELDNEADLVHRNRESEGFHKWFASYLKYIPAAHQGLAQAGHGAKVVLNGEAGIHIKEARKLIEQAGDSFSVINYHFYTGTVAPENAVNDTNTGQEGKVNTLTILDRVRQINKLAHDAGKESWLTEVAWAARRGPAVGDRLQSAYLHRIYLLGAWAGTDKTFWFWDRDLPGGGRFSSTGLIEQAEEKKNGEPKGALPAGAAMAAVSKFIAQAEYAGSVDIGTDRWCLVFKRPEGGYTIAAWAVGKEFPLPNELEAASESFGMYGNPLREKQVSDEPAYFHLAKLPEGWEQQLKVEWTSPRIVNIRVGGSAEVTLDMPAKASVRWEELPQEVQTTDLENGRGIFTAGPKLQPGQYPFSATVEGDGWSKTFPLSLKVRPTLDVETDSFAPGKPTQVKLTNQIGDEITVAFASTHGQAEPNSLRLGAGESGSVNFTAAEGTTAPAEVALSLNNGGSQTLYLRPRFLDVPKQADIKIDGDLADWPKQGLLTPNHLKIEGPAEEFQPQMKLAWSDKGLYVAAELPVGPDFEGASDPKSFWEWTGVEINVNAADVRKDRNQDGHRHLLYFTPVQDDDGNWSIYAGEWAKKMSDGSKKNLNDDKRPTTAARYDGETMSIEVFIPTEILGTAPSAGDTWPLSINSKQGKALSPRTVATWAAGKAGGSNGWGRIRFKE